MIGLSKVSELAYVTLNLTSFTKGLTNQKHTCQFSENNVVKQQSPLHWFVNSCQFAQQFSQVIISWSSPPNTYIQFLPIVA